MGAAFVILVLLVLGGLLRSQGAPESGAATTSAFLPSPRDPRKARDLLRQAAEWEFINNTAAARDLVEKAVQLDPDNAEAHYRLGGLFLASQPERARREYELSKQLNPHAYASNVDAILKGR